MEYKIGALYKCGATDCLFLVLSFDEQGNKIECIWIDSEKGTSYELINDSEGDTLISYTLTDLEKIIYGVSDGD